MNQINQELSENIVELFSKHYSNKLSENVKRGIRAKKLRDQNEKTFHKFIRKEELENKTLLYPITSSDFERLSNSKISDKNLYRAFIALTCFDNIQDKLQDIIKSVAKYIADESDPIWESIDDQFYQRNSCAQPSLSCKAK